MRRGDLFLADAHNHRVRRVDAGTGVITTVAGVGVAGFSGDGVGASAAALALPRGLVVDGAGNLFVADSGNHRIRRVDRVTGMISSVAGVGVQGFAGDGGAAVAAEVASPRGVALSGDGLVTLADRGNGRLRQVDAKADLQTIAGVGAVTPARVATMTALTQSGVSTLVVAVSSGAGAPGGSVTLMDANTAVGTATLSAGGDDVFDCRAFGGVAHHDGSLCGRRGVSAVDVSCLDCDGGWGECGGFFAGVFGGECDDDFGREFGGVFVSGDAYGRSAFITDSVCGFRAAGWGDGHLCAGVSASAQWTDGVHDDGEYGGTGGSANVTRRVGCDVGCVTAAVLAAQEAPWVCAVGIGDAGGVWGSGEYGWRGEWCSGELQHHGERNGDFGCGRDLVAFGGCRADGAVSEAAFASLEAKTFQFGRVGLQA